MGRKVECVCPLIYHDTGVPVHKGSILRSQKMVIQHPLLVKSMSCSTTGNHFALLHGCMILWHDIWERIGLIIISFHMQWGEYELVFNHPMGVQINFLWADLSNFLYDNISGAAITMYAGNTIGAGRHCDVVIFVDVVLDFLICSKARRRNYHSECGVTSKHPSRVRAMDHLLNFLCERDHNLVKVIWMCA